MRRNLIRYFNAPEGDAGGGGAGASESGGQEGTEGGGFAPITSQDDLNKIITDRVSRERAKYADYKDLKAKAEGAKSLEDRIAELESNGSKIEQRALRAEIAGEFGISTKKGPKGEPSDAELFLTGTDQESLTAQAQRLVQRESDRKKQGNVAPKEGDNPQPSDDPKRSFLRGITGSD